MTMTTITTSTTHTDDAKIVYNIISALCGSAELINGCCLWPDLFGVTWPTFCSLRRKCWNSSSDTCSEQFGKLPKWSFNNCKRNDKFHCHWNKTVQHKPDCFNFYCYTNCFQPNFKWNTIFISIAVSLKTLLLFNFCHKHLELLCSLVFSNSSWK